MLVFLFFLHCLLLFLTIFTNHTAVSQFYFCIFVHIFTFKFALLYSLFFFFSLSNLYSDLFNHTLNEGNALTTSERTMYDNEGSVSTSKLPPARPKTAGTYVLPYVCSSLYMLIDINIHINI